MNMKYILTLASACLSILISWLELDFKYSPDSRGTLTVNFSRAGMTNETDTNTDEQIHTLNAYRFENGILKESFKSLQVNDEGMCKLDLEQIKGNIYFLANGESVISKANLTDDVTTLDEFLNLTATSEEMASEYMLMNGMADLSSGNTSFSVALKRAVARIDLESSFQDAEVNRIVIKEVALTGLVHEAGNQSVLANLEKNELTKDFGEHPFKNGKESLYYLPEQTSNGHEVEIMMTANGGWHRLRTTLPALKRNTVYTLRVYGNGANLNVEVLTDNWESGDSSASGLTLKGLVDKENSQLSEGVTINERGDTVFIPCWESNFQLTLAAETGAEVSIFGEAEGVTVTPATRSRGLSPVAQINVASRQKMPGSKHEYV